MTRGPLGDAEPPAPTPTGPQMAVVDPGSTLYVGEPSRADGGSLVPQGLHELSASLYLLLITLSAWVIGCGCFCKWEIFPTMGWFMCTTFVVWAARQVLGDYFPVFAP